MKKNKSELLKIILEDNKSGYKTKEKYFSKNFPEEYEELKTFVGDNDLSSLPFKEKLYHFLNDIETIPVCIECGKKLKFKKSFSGGYGTYCSINCTNKSQKHINKVKSTNISKYGGISPISSEVVKSKIMNTNLKKYGVGNIFELKEYIQKRINEKYGNPIITKTNFYKKKMQKKYEEKYSHHDIEKSDEKIIYSCPVCLKSSEHDYNSFNYRNRNNISQCKYCVPPYQSMIETEMENFLTEIGLSFNKHNRKIIKPKEIDFYIPDKKIAIELNGLYYHSEHFVDADYHKNKWLECSKNEIDLIQIWEDEWKDKKDLIKKLISNKILENHNKIYARKCEISLLDNDVYKYFVENHHIQGYAPARIRLGLFYNNELVQVMSFSSQRKFMGTSKVENHYEMIRLCSVPDIKIIGGSKKLLSYFEKMVKPEKIVSYCDVRYFSGNSYLDMGFKFVGTTKVNYHYVKPNENKRLHRFNFRKDKLIKLGFDKNKSEKEIMSNLGYFRVYDAGNKKFEKSY
jgi:very-short-patch-repair endonuclease